MHDLNQNMENDVERNQNILDVSKMMSHTLSNVLS